MTTPVMIIIALLLPTFFLSLLIGPIYLGLCASLYFYYQMDDYSAYIYDPNYVLGAHEGLYAFGFEKGFAQPVGDFLLPVYGPVLAGVLLSLFLTYFFVTYLRNIFRLTGA